MRLGAVLLSLAFVLVQPAVGAPVAGYESYYNEVALQCTVPVGSVEACEIAITDYASVLVATVDIEVANTSFTALREEVYGVNDQDPVNEDFRDEIDALFELLLPESGALGALQSL